MKQITHIVLTALGLGLAATGAQAACVVEYKAKRDNPLELIYDVAQVGGDCSFDAAAAALEAQLAAQGVTLLKVLSVTEE